MYFHCFNRGLRFEGLVAIARAAVIPANSDSALGHSEMAPKASLSKRRSVQVQVTFLEPTAEYEKVQVKEELLPTLRKAIKETITEIEANAEVLFSKGSITAQRNSINFKLKTAVSHYDQGQILFLHGSDKFQIWLSSSAGLRNALRNQVKHQPASTKLELEKSFNLAHTKTFSVPTNFAQYMPKSQIKVAGKVIPPLRSQ
ncbi:uncharacterized protein C8R40DRAFT_1265337 [Lentinula edodes]|uniref:uncharacterized protein n=1 Tax=Lentinula edodes TaxID=5353 RepID=UPI001E8D4132|nr:uncharacterized protein C8R40DRAFT_1265337 [Lentinula edodes]KAH7875219.1 hypothetical protein C8R40DRAFT_1265337 [Lentinula edodes]